MKWYSKHVPASVVEKATWELVGKSNEIKYERWFSVFLLSRKRLDLPASVLLWMLLSFKIYNIFFFFLIKPGQREQPAYVARAFNYSQMIYLHVKLSPNELSGKKTVGCVDYHRPGVAYDSARRNSFLRREHILLFIETCLLGDHSQHPGFTVVITNRR